MKTITLLTALLISAPGFAELPSWGLTESQYKSPDFSSKVGEIGGQAQKNNWMLKVTAPNDWHNTIKNALTQTGARDVQFTFKDSLYQSVSISAIPGAKTANISPSKTSNSTVQKQVVIDKPQIDTAVEAPDFGTTSFKNNNDELLENIGAMEIPMPTVQIESVKPTIKAQTKEVVKAEINTTEPPKTPPQATAVPQVQPTPQPKATVPIAQVEEQAPAVVPAPKPAVVIADQANSELNTEEVKDILRKRHARSKRVDSELSYSSLNSKDEMFIDGSVVLIKRFVNQGVVLYYWMKEAYDPTVHKLVEKGSNKFKKDPTAIEGDVADEDVEIVQPLKPQVTELKFIAVDTVQADQDDLRSEYIRNKRVDYSLSADQLKSEDILYVQNQTVLVERPISRTQSAYYWLVGETTINSAVERKGDNHFVIK